MAKQSQIGSMPENILGMYADLSHKLQSGVLTTKELGLFLKRQNPFAISSIQDEWTEFYRKYFRISVDFSGVSIPEEQAGFTRTLFIPEGLTINQVIKAMNKCFPVWTYRDDLDQDVIVNDRNSTQSYAISVRDRVEADEELKNLSAKDLQKQGINTLTLPERLVYEIKYWSETTEHLDVTNITLCAGSRYRLGDVPYVDWDGDELRVNYCIPSDACDDLRARAAVS